MIYYTLAPFYAAVYYPRKERISKQLSLFWEALNSFHVKLSLFISTKAQLRFDIYLTVRCSCIIHSSTLTNTFKVRKISFFFLHKFPILC